MIKKSTKLLFLLFIVLASYVDVLGQEPFYWQLTEEDGLPSMTIYQIHQDKKGFMWFGTENGICRYDGKEMETYYHPDLLDNEILTIQEDSWGRIWFKNLAGQLGYVEDGIINFSSIKFKTLKEFCVVDESLLTFQISYSSANTVLGIKINQYLIGKDGELILKKENTIKSFYTGLGGIQIKENKIFLFAELLNSEKKILEYDCSNFTTKYYSFFESNVERPNRIQILPGNQIMLNARDGKASQYELKGDSVFFVKEYDYQFNDKSIVDEEIILAGIDGVFLYKNNNLLLDRFKLNSVALDKEQALWLATKNNGIIIIPELKYRLYNTENSNIFNNSLFTIYPYSENALLVGHDNGRLSIIEHGEKVIQQKISINGKTRTIIKDSKERFWIGGDNFDLTIFSKELKELKRFKNYNSVKELSKGNDNSIWVGLYGSVNKLETGPFFQNENKEEFKWISTNTFLGKDNTKIGPFPKILNLRTYAIFSTPKNIWLGTVKGVYKYQNDKPIPFLENGKHIPYSVSAITQSKDSTIWVSTQVNGIFGIKNDSVIYRLDEQSGLATNNCSNLFYDEYNNLWIGSKKGLHKLNLSTFEIDIINKYDGMPTNEISAVYARDSILWVGTQKGLIEIPYSAIQKNITPPPIHITNIAFWEKDTTLLSSYDLKYNQNNINIEFVGITYRNRGNTDYQYRMLGVDTNWVNTSTRFARYPLLNPGEYEFQVKAINEDGVESIFPAKIQLVIHRPWWQTWWFYLLIFISGVGLIGGFFYRRFQRIRKEEKQQQEFDEKINDLRMMALQAQMNPHFVFNALSAIQKFLTTDEQEQAMIYLARFAQLIRNIFEQSKEKLITLDEEFEFLKLYLDLEKLRFKDKVKINFHVDKTISEDDYDLQIPPLIIQPIVENAFKHGLMHKEEGGELDIEFSKNEEYLFCKIEDNGVGRKMAKQMGEGKLKEERPSGLKTARERLTILNQSSLEINDFNNLVIKDLLDGNQNPIGTRVEIKIKYNNE